MKYSVFELLEDPSKSDKSLKVLKEEATSRGWEECSNPQEAENIVRNMIKKGFIFVDKEPIGKQQDGGSWGQALYFVKKA